MKNKKLVGVDVGRDEQITEVMCRAAALFGSEVDYKKLRKNITAICKGNKIDAGRLLSFDDFNFMHDISGFILNWNGKEFTNHFLPRCSKKGA